VDKHRCKQEARETREKQKTAPQASGHGHINPADLLGTGASSLGSEMNSRGFRNTGGYKSDDTFYTTLWNSSAQQCVSVAVRQGRVDKVENIFEGNCK
jgi:hypothetical protein